MIKLGFDVEVTVKLPEELLNLEILQRLLCVLSSRLVSPRRRSQDVLDCVLVRLLGVHSKGAVLVCKVVPERRATFQVDHKDRDASDILRDPFDALGIKDKAHGVSNL